MRIALTRIEKGLTLKFFSEILKLTDQNLTEKSLKNQINRESS